MVLPWLSGSSGSGSHPPAWLSYFIATAAQSAMLVDWLLFHEGALKGVAVPPTAPNVKLINVGRGKLAELVGQGLSAALELPEQNASIITGRLQFMFGKWPLLIAE